VTHKIIDKIIQRQAGLLQAYLIMKP